MSTLTAQRRELEHRRDAALRDLLGLDRQAREGELTLEVEEELRRSYHREAAAAIDALTRLDVEQEEATSRHVVVPNPAQLPTRQPRVLLYGAGFLAMLAAALLLPGFVMDRPTGGFVTGNEALQNSNSGGTESGPPATGRNLADVTDEEMEAVVAANPELIGMRLALANRYTEKGRYDLALVHYRKALEQDPANADAKAHLGWLLLQTGRADLAAQLVDEALAADPELLDALWFKANVRLYGFDDAPGAIAVLDEMSSRPGVTPEVRTQIDALRTIAAAAVAD